MKKYLLPLLLCLCCLFPCLALAAEADTTVPGADMVATIIGWLPESWGQWITFVVTLCAAISAISMYALPSLYDQISLLRLLVLFFCGILGPVGLALSIAVLLAAVSIADDEGQAYLYPLSPLQKNSIRDGYIRMPWKRLKNSRFSIAAIRPREAGEGDEQ